MSHISSKYLQQIQCQANSLEYFCYVMIIPYLFFFGVCWVIFMLHLWFESSQQSPCKSLHSVSEWLTLTRQHTSFGDHLGHHYRPNKQMPQRNGLDMQRKVGQVGRVEFVFEQAVGRVREMLWCGKTVTGKKKKKEILWRCQSVDKLETKTTPSHPILLGDKRNIKWRRLTARVQE